MKFSDEYNEQLKKLIMGDMLSSLGVAHSAALYIQQNEPLTVMGLAKAGTALSMISNCIRSTIILNDLITDNNDFAFSKSEYYNIDKFFNSVVKELNTLFSGGIDVNFAFSSNLNKNRTFYINSYETEKMLYEIVYCLVKGFDENDKKELKISFDETHGKQNAYVITLSTSGNAVSKRISDIINSKGKTEVDFFDLDAIGILNLCKKVDALNGKIKYTRLKTMNKIILTLPSKTEFDSAMEESRIFTPDAGFIKGFFGSLLYKK